jgi:hypothetical protein
LLDEDDEGIIRMVLFETYPPTNPAVLLRAASAWYSEHGHDEVLDEVIAWLAYVTGAKYGNMDDYEKARKIFSQELDKIDIVSNLTRSKPEIKLLSEKEEVL